MNERQRSSSRPAFEKAADAAAAWRQQQIAALTEAQRRLYDQARRRAARQAWKKKRELLRRREADIRERARRKLLARQKLEMNLPGRRTRSNAEHIRRQLAQYVGAHIVPKADLYAHVLKQVAWSARREIAYEHAREHEAFRHRQRQHLDKLLARFERSRAMKGRGQDAFTRANVRDHARSEFRRAARDQAIARAIQNTRNKQEHDRGRGPGEGRGR